jgi:phosphatidylserine/phosphatidylglycerophosphate/cardiolipin synthase-like enzyme
MLMIYDRGVVAQLAAEQERIFANCRLLDLEAWRQRSLASKLVENLARMLSPLL